MNFWGYLKWVIPTAVIGTGIYLVSKISDVQIANKALLDKVKISAKILAERLQTGKATLGRYLSIIKSACMYPQAQTQQSEITQTACKNLIEVVADSMRFMEAMLKATTTYLAEPDNLELLDAFVKTIEMSYYAGLANPTTNVIDVWRDRYKLQISLLLNEQTNNPSANGIIRMLTDNGIVDFKPYVNAMWGDSSVIMTNALTDAKSALAKTQSSKQICFGI